ncbi:MAG: EamA family transporter [Candidatus Roizmanbacteria bacterium]
MNWFYLTIFSILFGSIANILQRVLMKHDKSDPYAYAIFFHLFLGILNFVFGLWYGSNFSYHGENIIYLFISSLLWGTCTVFLFKALQVLESSEVTILESLKVPITIVLAIITFHESFGLTKIIATSIILIATWLVAGNKEKFKVNNGVWYMVVVAITSALGIIVDSYSVKHFDVVFYNMITNFLIVPILICVRPNALSKWNHFLKADFLIRMLPMCVFSTAQAILYLYSLTDVGNTAQITAIRQSKLIVTVLLAVIFLQEKQNLSKKLFAAFLVTIASVLLK